MFNGKKKALTFSYDDGVTQDVKLIEIFNKYNMKATFNINSELLGLSGSLKCNNKIISHNKNKREDIKYIYENHEVAAHTLTHQLLPKLNESEIIYQVEQDRQNLSELVGYQVCGMAYPCGGKNYDSRVSTIIKEKTGIKYCRTIETTNNFAAQTNLYEFKGTIYHHNEWDKLIDIGDKFLKLKTDEPAIFYIWGHSYEFDIFPERWKLFEEFCQMMSNKNDIFYGTNSEILLGGSLK